MKLTNMQRSTSKHGGWIIEATGRRMLMSMLRHKPRQDWRETPAHRIWLSEQLLKEMAWNFDNFEQMAKTAGYIGNGKQETQPPPPPKPEIPTTYQTLFLLPIAPTRVVMAVFRDLAKAYHPDLGGTHEKMKALNLAYADIMAEPKRQAYLKSNERK